MSVSDIINTPIPETVNKLMWLIILVGGGVIIYVSKLLIGAGKEVWNNKKEEVETLREEIKVIRYRRDAAEKDTLATLGMLTEYLKTMKGSQTSEKELILSKLQEAIEHIKEVKK